MGIALVISALLATSFTFGQSLSDKYLHFKTDYYWDTTIYRSELDYYFDLSDGRIIQKQYPVLRFLFSSTMPDSPYARKDSFERQGSSDYPYSYTRRGKGIYLQYFNQGKGKLKTNKEYSLNLKDTVFGMANKYSLDSKNGISIEGYSIYLGEAKVEINEKSFDTFRFLEVHEQHSSHSSYFTREVFLENKYLIPIKVIHSSYDFKTRRKTGYSQITILASSGNTLPDYESKTTDDLVLYEDKNIFWTEEQKQLFLSVFPSGLQEFAKCLLSKLDGQVSFYHYERSIYWKKLIVNENCEY